MKDEDRGYVSKRYDYWVTDTDSNHKIRELLLYIFISLNILIPFTTATFTADLYRKLCQKIIKNDYFRTSPQVTSYIWAIALLLVFFNWGYLLASLLILMDGKPFVIECMTKHCVVPKHTLLYKDEFTTCVAKFVTVSTAFVMELIVAIRVTKNLQFPYPPLLLICHCKCYKTKMSTKILQTFLLWNALIFVQLVGGSIALPLCIFVTIAPVATIQVISVSVSAMLFFTIVFSYLLQTESNILYKYKWRTCLVQLVAATTIMALIVALTVLYNSVLDSGASPTIGFRRLLLSLVPPFSVSLIILLIKRRLLSRKDFSARVVTDNQGQVNSMEEGVDLSVGSHSEQGLLQNQTDDTENSM